jgi:hypothetical protein
MTIAMLLRNTLTAASQGKALLEAHRAPKSISKII